MNTLKQILLLAIAGVLLTGCCAGGRRVRELPAGETPATGSDVTPYPTRPPAPAGKAVAADGKLISPYPSVGLGFGGSVSGDVLSIDVKAGDTVAAGDVLATLDDAELQRAVDEAQLTLDRVTADRDAAAEQWERDVADAEEALADAERTLTIARLEFSDTSLEQARRNLEWAQKSEADRKADYEQAQTLWPPIPVDGYRDAWNRAIDEREMAERRLADAENAYQAQALRLKGYEANVAKAGRNLAALQEGVKPGVERAVEDAEIVLARAKETLEHARIVAPWPAIVLSVNVSPGATVGAGTPVVTLLNIEDGLRFATQELSEQHVADIYPGQRAVVTLRAFANSPLEGTVESVVPQTGANADARFTIHVQLPATDLRLLPGLTGRVEIYTVEE